MAENGFFKTAFRGFRKEDVLNYIDSLNAEHCEETEALQTEKTQLAAQLSVLQQQLPALQEQADAAAQLQQALEQAEGRLALLEQENDALTAKLSAAEAEAARLAHLPAENEAIKQQLEAQSAQLLVFEKLFGDSRDAASYVRENVTAKLSEGRRRTEKTLTAVEQLTSRLENELEQLRRETAAVRSAMLTADSEDAAALSAWFEQFDKKVPTGTDSHFFR